MMEIRLPLYNSVLGKELRTRMRGWSAVFLITIYMLVFGLIAGGILIQQAGQTVGEASGVGVKLFTALAGLQLVLILLVTPSTTAGAISGERQRQTWDLLLITRLSTIGIVWGKLASGVAFQILLMFAALPIFSLVFLFGGVSPGDIFHVYLMSVVTAILIGSLSIFISSLSRRVATAIIVANVTSLVLALGFSIIEIFLQGAMRSSSGRWPALSPLAQLNPVVALLSALPKQGGGSYLGQLNWVHDSFLIFGTIPYWESYAIVGSVLACALTLLAAYFAQSRTRWLSRGTS
jgi:ABC-2 type transport system permease protein